VITENSQKRVVYSFPHSDDSISGHHGIPGRGLPYSLNWKVRQKHRTVLFRHWTRGTQQIIPQPLKAADTAAHTRDGFRIQGG
jgi:hypothetical protein